MPLRITHGARRRGPLGQGTTAFGYPSGYRKGTPNVPLAPRILCSDDIYRLAVWQNMTIAEFAGDVDALRMRRVGRAHRELAASYPDGTVSCTIVRQGVPVASEEARDEAVQFMKELGDSLRRSALIIEDTGIMAQVLRTVVRGFNVITRNTKLVLCANLDEVVNALSPLVVPVQEGGNVRAELAAAVTAARRGYEPRPAAQAAQR